MGVKEFQADVRNNGGFILSDGTLEVVVLLCKAHDLMASYDIDCSKGRGKSLRKYILKALGLPASDRERVSAFEAYYYGRIQPKASMEELEYLWNEDLFNMFNTISPKGYYFGSHPGDGACIGWFKVEDDW